MTSSTEKMSILTKQGLATYLQVNIRTIDRLVSQRIIPFVRIGRSVRFLRESINAWLLEQEKCCEYDVHELNHKFFERE